MRLRVVDLETTGLTPPDAGVCEIGFVDVVAEHFDLAVGPTDWRIVPTIWSHLVDPNHPIPPEVSAIHHLVDEDVRGATSWPDAVAHLRDMLDLAPIEKLIEWSSEPALHVRCHIGKWRGTPWSDVDDGFLRWVSERDFDEDVLFTVRHEMQRRQDEREVEKARAATRAPLDPAEALYQRRTVE